MTAALNIQALPSPQIWVSSLPTNSGTALADEQNNAITDENGTVILEN